MKKVLLVDDQENFTTMMSVKLKSMGYEVYTAVNGKIAVDLARQHNPPLIVMDIMMPVMDGFTAAEEIRNIPELKDAGIIFLSAKGLDKDKERANELGALHFISKPFSPKDLVEKIEQVFR